MSANPTIENAITSWKSIICSPPFLNLNLITIHLIHHQRADIRQRSHINNHDNHLAPTVGFRFPMDCHGGHALAKPAQKYHQRKWQLTVCTAVFRFQDRFHCGAHHEGWANFHRHFLHYICCQCANQHFAGGEWRNQTDAQFPVKTQRFDNRLDDLPDLSGITLAEFVRRLVTSVRHPFWDKMTKTRAPATSPE